MNNKYYKIINQELEKEFGKGNVRLIPAIVGADWEYTLWFLDDNPDKKDIEKAKEIVNQYIPTLWMDKLSFHS